MWNNPGKKARNYLHLKSICYRCTDEDLGKKKISEKERHRKAYARIFQHNALNNMKERLKTFNQFQTQLKQQNYEKEKVSD